MRKPGSRSATTAPRRGLVITRLFDAPRELVFDAWTKPEHLEHWFGRPRGARVPHFKAEPRVGGLLHFKVELPDGIVVWGRGEFREIVRPERVVIADWFSDEHGNIAEPPPGLPRESLIIATFLDVAGKTRLIVEHAGVEEASPENVDAYRQGWGESLDLLGERLAAPGRAAPVRGTGMRLEEAGWSLTRRFDTPPELVFRAWTDPAHVARWWGPESFTVPKCELDVRPGGEYRIVMRAPDGFENTICGRYLEVRPPARLVFDIDTDRQPQDWHRLVEQHGGGNARGVRIVVTVELEPSGTGTRMRLSSRFPTDAYRDAHLRIGAQEGWSESIEKLARSLR